MSDTDVDEGHTSQIIENSIMKSWNEFALNILLEGEATMCAFFHN